CCPFSIFSLFFFLTLRPPISTLFPYTTLFRSVRGLPDTLAPSDRWGHELASSGADFSEALQVPQVAPRPTTLLTACAPDGGPRGDRKSTRLNSSHGSISYAVFCLKKKKEKIIT